MRTYETMRKLAPDFFVHSGDHIYADNPFQPKLQLDDGTEWTNIVTKETSKVAETLSEFHANYHYNLLDEHVRRFNAEVPVFSQWDDHETMNNWYPGEQLVSDDRYNVMAISDAMGNVVERYEYQDLGDPEFFDGSGVPISGTAIGNPYLFTGRRYDDETS